MHVAIVTETYPPEINGVALTVQSLETGLRQIGHSVEVIRPRQSVDAGAAAEFELLVAGADVPRYPGLRFGLPAGRSLQARWRNRRPDALYVATEGPLGFSALRSARRLGMPAATGFHTRFDDYVGRYASALLAPLVFGWLRRFHNSAQATLVPTDELAGFLRTRGFANVQLLRRAVDTTQFAPAFRDPGLREQWGVEGNAPALLYVGRIAAEKNLELAVRAYRAIREQHAGARFVLVGDGPVREQLAAANPDLVFAGVRRGEDLARYYASADLFLFPSLSETFGNVTLEAMASGIATVAFDYGAAREHLIDGEHGAAIDREDAEGFIDAAVRLAGDPTRCRQLGENARAAVAALSPSSVAENFEQLLAGLASQRSAA